MEALFANHPLAYPGIAMSVVMLIFLLIEISQKRPFIDRWKERLMTGTLFALGIFIIFL